MYHNEAQIRKLKSHNIIPKLFRLARQSHSTQQVKVAVTRVFIQISDRSWIVLTDISAFPQSLQ
jgi:hypothetical protein